MSRDADAPVLQGEVVGEQGRNLTKRIGNVNERDNVKEYLDREVIAETLRTMEPGRDHLFINTLWHTGVRVTEAIHIQKQHIDFENRELKIRWQKNRKYKNRIIPMKPVLAQMLRFYTTNMVHDERLFDFTRQTGYNIVQKHLGVSPHVIRHSFAVNFLRQQSNAMGLRHLQRMLGHSNIQTTMEYLAVVPNDLHEAMSSVEFS